jgi:hypothetical protein
MAAKPKAQVLTTGAMICFSKNLVLVIGTMACAKNAIVPMLEAAVIAAKKTVLAPSAMVCKVLARVWEKL